MIGLLKKDLYMTWAYCRIFLLMIAVFLVVGAVDNDNSFFVIYPMIIGMILPVSLVSYDERFKWHLSCDAMPVSRAKYVSAKYVLTLTSVLVVFLLTLLIQGIRLFPQGRLAALWDLAGMLLPMGLLGPALLLPVIFRLGVEKGRIFYFVLVGIVCAAGVMLGGELGSLPDLSNPLLPGAASVLLFAASWFLAVKLYQKREL